MPYVVLESWAGRTYHPVEILKETPKRYKVRWLGPGVFRRFSEGGVYYVPKHCVVKNHERHGK